MIRQAIITNKLAKLIEVDAYEKYGDTVEHDPQEYYNVAVSIVDTWKAGNNGALPDAESLYYNFTQTLDVNIDQ